jgi:hypothetical protein
VAPPADIQPPYSAPTGVLLSEYLAHWASVSRARGHRFAGTPGGEWTYRLDTLNVAHGPAPVNLFLSPQPSRQRARHAALSP